MTVPAQEPVHAWAHRGHARKVQPGGDGPQCRHQTGRGADRLEADPDPPVRGDQVHRLQQSPLPNRRCPPGHLHPMGVRVQQQDAPPPVQAPEQRGGPSANGTLSVIHQPITRPIATRRPPGPDPDPWSWNLSASHSASIIGLQYRDPHRPGKTETRKICATWKKPVASRPVTS